MALTLCVSRCGRHSPLDGHVRRQVMKNVFNNQHTIHERYDLKVLFILPKHAHNVS